MDASTRLEAMRIARLMVKNAMLKDGLKPCNFTAKEVTEMAKAVLDAKRKAIERKAKRIMKIRSLP